MDPLDTSHQIYSLWAKPVKTLYDLMDTLTELGWKIEPQSPLKSGNVATWFAFIRSSTGAHCETNKSCPHFLITPFEINSPLAKTSSVEISIVGEANGQWWDIKCYTVPVDRVIPSLPKICTGLLAAWNALPRDM
jgi:hypothetical protein